MRDNDFLLKVEDLKTYFFLKEGTLKVVDKSNFNLRRGETLGIAGDSGCGKSITVQSILRIVPQGGKIVGGKILFNLSNKGFIDLAKLDPRGKKIRSIRGKEISMIELPRFMVTVILSMFRCFDNERRKCENFVRP